jgi:hypothetical protein
VDVLDDLGDVSSAIGGLAPVGILIALVGAIFLSVGAQFQHRGVEVVEASHGTGARAGLSLRQLTLLLARPSWGIGTAMLALAILLQLAALGFAPLIVVQPVGAVGLVVAALVNARVTRSPIPGPVWRAIAFCVGGIALFVTVAAFVAKEQIVEETQLVIILSILGGVIVLLALTFSFARKKAGALFYIVAAGVLYGFVATLAKVVINRVGNLLLLPNFGIGGDFEWLTLGCVVALIAAVVLGAYFVQTAYSLGSPDLVIAGLTVVDPLIAVVIGISVLGEAANAPLWAVPVWAVAGAVAVYGVFQLAKHHPQTHR